jgi:hypothetical protein
MSDHEKAEALTEFIIATRDQCQTMVTVCEGLLRMLEQQERKEKKGIVESKGPAWNPEGMKWVDVQGGKGPYQKSEDVDNLDFKEMLKDLAAHKGKLYKNGLFYWTFPNGTTVGRKRVRKA